MEGQTATAEQYDGSTPLDHDKHELFCHEYLVDLNGKEAYIRAGYSENGAKQGAHRLLTSVDFRDVQMRVAFLKGQRIDRAQKTGDDVIRELEHIAFSRLGHVVVVNPSGASFVHSPETLPDADHAAIQSIEVKEDHYGNGEGAVLNTKVKMYDKLPALKMLAKHHGVCQDKLKLQLDGDSLPEGLVIQFISADKKDEVA